MNNQNIKEALKLGLSLAQWSHHKQLFSECLLAIESEKPKAAGKPLYERIELICATVRSLKHGAENDSPEYDFGFDAGIEAAVTKIYSELPKFESLAKYQEEGK